MSFSSAKQQGLADAITEAERFLGKAQVALVHLACRKNSYMQSIPFATAKRASLDLTRALAKMRRDGKDA